MRGPKRTKLNKGTVVEGQDEKRIFDILGVPWRPPESLTPMTLSNHQGKFDRKGFKSNLEESKH